MLTDGARGNPDIVASTRLEKERAIEMKGYTIWNVRLNTDTHNFGGAEWVVDGERGRYTYPGTMPECLARRLYQEGLSSVPEVGYCDGCTGAKSGRYCSK